MNYEEKKSIFTEEARIKRFQKMCDNWGTTMDKANEIDEKCQGLQKHFLLSEKDSWLIAKIFTVNDEGAMNYINAVLQDIEDEELEKKENENDGNNSSFG